MADQIVADVVALADAADRFSTKANELNQIKKDLDTQAHGDSGGKCFGTKANPSFSSLWEAWYPVLGNLATTLHAVGVLLSNTASDFISNDTAAATAFKNDAADAQKVTADFKDVTDQVNTFEGKNNNTGGPSSSPPGPPASPPSPPASPPGPPASPPSP